MSVAINGAGSISGLDQGFNVTTGSVGIGTDNPTQKLELLSTGNTIVKLGGASANTTGIIINRGGSEVSRIAHSNSDDLSFYTTSSVTERLRITSAGLVGIGLINPDCPLEVNNPTTGAVGFKVSNAGGNNGLSISNFAIGGANFGGANIDAPHSVHGTLTLSTTGSERLRITSGGDVLIADTTNSIYDDSTGGGMNLKANGQLVLKKQASSTADPLMWLNDTGQTTNKFILFAQDGNEKASIGLAGNDLRFARDGYNETLRITSAGKLTVTPADTTSSYATTDGGIDIAQTISSTGTSASQSIGIQFSLTKSGQTGAIAEIGAIREGSGLSGLVFRTRDNSTGRNERLRISSDGKVCVGTTLTNYGVLQIRDASGDGTTSAIQVENASSGNNTTNVILRSVNLNSGAWAAAEYRAKNHIFSYQTTQVATIQQHGMTIASQPCFWATSNTGGSDTNNGYHGIISNQFEAAYVNVGNHYNTSTGVFTCPVAGVYEFHGQGLARQQGGDGNMELTFFKNGSNTMTRSYGYTYVKGQSDHDNLHVMAFITCAANDQIDLRTHALASGVDCYWGQGLGYFAGRLVQ